MMNHCLLSTEELRNLVIYSQPNPLTFFSVVKYSLYTRYLVFFFLVANPILLKAIRIDPKIPEK